MRVKIDEEILFNKYLPPTSKLTYLYLSSICNKNTGVCEDGTPKQLADKFGVTPRSAQYMLKHLFDFGFIGKAKSEEGGSVPKLFIRNGDIYIPKKPKINKESDLVPDKDLLKLIEIWNELYGRQEKFTDELAALFRKRVEDIPVSDIFKAVRKRYESIKDDPFWNEPSRIYIKTSLKLFLKDHDTIDAWRSNKSTGNTRQYNAFDFLES